MMNDFSVDMNEYLPLRDVVFNTLRKAILKGELKPGERLMEIALAERLGVSRTPVREAMRKLELEGLVVMIPRRGAQVANITEKDLNDVLEVRIYIKFTISYFHERFSFNIESSYFFSVETSSIVALPRRENNFWIFCRPHR